MEMKNKKAMFLSVPIVVLILITPLFFNFYWPERPLDKNQAVKQVIMRSLDQAHFNKQNLNDEFSEKAFDLYIKMLDDDKRFMRQEDYDKMVGYRQKIDDELQADFGEFLKLSAEIMDLRVQDVKGYITEILSEPFDFDKEESIELDEKKRGYSKSAAEHKETWRKTLKYQVLLQLHNKIEAQDKKEKLAKEEGTEFEKKSQAELEKSAREQVSKTFLDWFSRMEREDDDDKRAKLINAIVGVYGPHTEFFPPEEKETFDIRMSGKLEGIGAQLIERDGEIKVTRIVPGSASWKQGELKEDDIILKVAQDGEEPVSIVGMLLKDAVKLIRGPKDSDVHLTVKKKSGEIKVIVITRDVVILEESFVKSAVIKSKETNLKIGYIMLPSFYADFSGRGGRNCGDDVAIEVEKLKKQNVDAMVLDLRNNGGGSLRDAIQISGLFIESGPVVQVRDRIQSSRTHRDPDNEIKYDGPLVVMVNRFSASASEITAAALQDYGRALIVGENSFGKGTVQRFIDLDRAMDQKYRPAGSLKLTIQKFYRITGKTTQVQGVAPDIKLPDPYAYLEFGEKELDHVLPFDEIKPVLYKKWKASKFDVKSLGKKSGKRVKKNDTFTTIDQYAQMLKQRQDKTGQTLNYKTFVAEQKVLKEESKKFENLKFDHKTFDVDIMSSVASSGSESEELTSVRVKSGERWLKDINSDVYIYEATQVVSDMIK